MSIYVSIYISHWFCFSGEPEWYTWLLSQVANCPQCSQEKLEREWRRQVREWEARHRSNFRSSPFHLSLAIASLGGYKCSLHFLLWVSPGNRLPWPKHCPLRENARPRPQQWSSHKLIGQRRNWLIDITMALEGGITLFLCKPPTLLQELTSACVYTVNAE